MQSKDVRDILGVSAAIPSTHLQGGGGSTAIVKSEKEKRPEGVNRELFALIGGAPPLTFASTVQQQQSYYKPKALLTSAKKKPAAKWKWTSFKNPARNDALQLSHWIREDEENKEYEFAKLNKHVSVVTYTDEEYTTHLQDPNWTKEETDYLFELCKMFELRFIVIQDRYELPDKQRTVEDLKERYYSVTGKVQSARATATGTVLEPAPYVFDKEREIQRKKNLEILHTRTPDVIKEEEFLFFELKRREVAEKKWSQERDKLARLFTSPEMAAPAGHDLKKRSKKGDLVYDPITGMKKDRKGGREEEVYLKRVNMPQGAHLRSTRFSVSKASIQNKFKEINDAYAIPAIPNMPTHAVCEKFEQLRQNIINLLDLKRAVDRQEQEIRVLTHRKRILETEGPIIAPQSVGLPAAIPMASAMTPLGAEGFGSPSLGSAQLLGLPSSNLGQKIKKRPLNSPAVGQNQKRNRVV